MIGAAPLLVAVLALGAPQVKNRELSAGIELYDAENYAEALGALTAALDVPSNRWDQARIHLYIGLIQHRYKLRKDAEESFNRALDYDPAIRPPRGTPERVKALFSRIRKEKFGEDSSEAPPKPKKRVPKSGRAGPKDEEPRDEAIPAPERVDDPRAGTATVSAAFMDEGDDEFARDEREPGIPTYRPSDRDRLVPPETRDEYERISGGDVAAWIAIGVGVAATATGITFGALAAKNGGDIDGERSAKRTEELYQTAVKQRTAAIVSFSVSGASLGLAMVLLLTQ